MTTKFGTTMIQARSHAEAQAIVRELHPNEVIDSFDCNGGYDVLVWATEAASINDDGRHAIARYRHES